MSSSNVKLHIQMNPNTIRVLLSPGDIISIGDFYYEPSSNTWHIVTSRTMGIGQKVSKKTEPFYREVPSPLAMLRAFKELVSECEVHERECKLEGCKVHSRQAQLAIASYELLLSRP